MNAANEHPDEALRARWLSGTLDAAQMLALDDHFSTCARCATALAADDRAAGADSAVARHLASALGDDHLAETELHAWVDGDLDDTARERIAEHLALCERCREAADDLQALAADLSAPVTPRGIGARLRWPLIAAAAVVLALGLRALLDAPRHPLPGRETQPTAPSAAAIPTAPPPSAKVVAEVLRDGGLTLTLTDGRVGGVPERWQALAAAALTSGELETPAVLRTLARRSDSERGASEESPVHLLGPLSQVVEEERPELRWQGPADATYRVELFDESFEPLAASPELRAQAWRPEKPLPPGALVNWKVTIFPGEDGQASFPRAPEAPAVFATLSREHRAAIAAARTTGSHLLVGLELWRAGLIAPAAAELATFGNQNPRSPAAKRLARAAAEARSSNDAPGSSTGGL